MRPWCSTMMRELISRTNSRSCSTSSTHNPCSPHQLDQDAADQRALRLGQARPSARPAAARSAPSPAPSPVPAPACRRARGAATVVASCVGSPVARTTRIAASGRRTLSARARATAARAAARAMRSDSATVSASNTFGAWNLRPRPRRTQRSGGMRPIATAADRDLAGAALLPVADAADQRGLAGAVRADQADQFAGPAR